MTIEHYDSIVVGGGIAGLTSATYLARGGQRVLLIEKNEKCGGLVSTFARDGFYFEAGVRALEDAGIILPMLKDLGIELEMVKSPVSVGIEDQIILIEDLDSIKTYRDLLVNMYPGSQDEVDAVIKVVKRIMKHMEILYGIENPIFKDIKKDRQYLFRQLLPWLPRFAFTIGKINRMNMPVEAYIDSLVKDPSLRDIIVQHFFKNTPTFFALSYFSLYLDYFYPKGGVGKLAEAVQDKFASWGGQVLTETTVNAVDLKEQWVRTSGGTQFRYDDLVWAGDLKTFYRISDYDGLPAKNRAEFQKNRDLVTARRGGDSVFTLFMEVDAPLERFRQIASGHFFYTPSRKGLGDTHWGEMRGMLQNFDALEKDQVLDWLRRFTQLNTYEIAIPGLKDPDLVPEGKTGLIISLLAEYDLFRKVQDAGWYDEFKTAMEEAMIDVISASVYPFLKDSILKRFSFTPLSIQGWTGSSEGAITGWSFEESVPVVNKIQYSDRSVLTAIPNVFIAGQWAYSPAGVPMSILTGKLAADRVVKRKR